MSNQGKFDQQISSSPEFISGHFEWMNTTIKLVFILFQVMMNKSFTPWCSNLRFSNPRKKLPSLGGKFMMATYQWVWLPWTIWQISLKHLSQLVIEMSCLRVFCSPYDSKSRTGSNWFSVNLMTFGWILVESSHPSAPSPGPQLKGSWFVVFVVWLLFQNEPNKILHSN